MFLAFDCNKVYDASNPRDASSDQFIANIHSDQLKTIGGDVSIIEQ